MGTFFTDTLQGITDGEGHQGESASLAVLGSCREASAAQLPMAHVELDCSRMRSGEVDYRDRCRISFGEDRRSRGNERKTWQF